MKILYVTRKFPPTVGGMENVAAWLYEELSAREIVKLIKYGGANKYLPIVFPWLVLRTVLAGWFFRPDIVYVQDGLMGAATPVFRALLRCQVVATIHGTEMVYDNLLYKKTVIPALRHLSAAAVISRATDEKVHEELPGIPTRIIHWGVSDDFYIESDRRRIQSSLGEAFHISVEGRPVICLIGRMTERKGARWFVENVMPGLAEQIPDLVCLIVGQGKDYDEIKAVIEQRSLSESIFLLGYALGDQLKFVYNSADLFIMPNRDGYGFEGFGMVAIEATSCGTPAVVGAFAGAIDAVIDGKTGWLVSVDDVDAYTTRILDELTNPSLSRASVRTATLEAYDWGKAADAYLEFFAGVIESAEKG